MGAVQSAPAPLAQQYRPKRANEDRYPFRAIEPSLLDLLAGVPARHPFDRAYATFPNGFMLFHAFFEKTLGYSVAESPGFLIIKDFNSGASYSEPEYHHPIYRGSSFVPGEPQSILSMTHPPPPEPLSHLVAQIHAAKTRFVFVFVQMLYTASNDTISQMTVGAHATGILFDRVKQEVLSLDPLNDGGYNDAAIRKSARMDQDRCAHLHRAFQREDPAFGAWKFNSIATQLGAALWYVEVPRPSHSSSGYCIPLLYYHVLALIIYLPLLETVLSKEEMDDMSEQSFRFKAITTLVTHTMCHPLPSTYPPPQDYLFKLFGGEVNVGNVPGDDARANIRQAIGVAFEEQTDSMSLYNRTCFGERQGWRNLQSFCDSVMKQYFPAALSRANLPPMYLWRHQYKRDSSDPTLYFDPAGLVYTELWAMERHANHALRVESGMVASRKRVAPSAKRRPIEKNKVIRPAASLPEFHDHRE